MCVSERVCIVHGVGKEEAVAVQETDNPIEKATLFNYFIQCELGANVTRFELLKRSSKPEEVCVCVFSLPIFQY